MPVVAALHLTLQGTEWPVRLGRVDSSDGGAPGRIPADDAPTSEIVAFMKQLGAKPGMSVFMWGMHECSGCHRYLEGTAVVLWCWLLCAFVQCGIACHI